MPTLKPTPDEAAKIVRLLDRAYPQKAMIDFGSPEDTLIATLLSARTTDAQVVKVYPGLRAAFPTLRRLADASESAIAVKISSIGLYRAKAKHVKALARRLIDAYGGGVPAAMDDLLTLPGVGRKTASCVLWYGFGIPAMAVDTHVFRIARRLGWANGKDPASVEKALVDLVPRKWWGPVNRAFIPFGRDICRPGTPQCWRCPIAASCVYPKKTPRPASAG
jgi:endonuclease-3